MADFSINSTELSGPQGSGTGALAPVQQQAVDTGIMPVLKDISNIFVNGLKGYKADQAAAQQTAVVSGYAKKQQAINDGIASGQIDPSRGSTMSRALFGQYIASNPQYIKDLHEAQKAFTGGSELGEAEQKVKDQKDEWKADMSLARSRGVIVDPQASPVTQQAVIQNMKKSIVAEREYDQFLKRSAEKRAMSAEDRLIEDRELKERSLKLVTQIAGDNLEITSTVLQDLSDQVKRGLPYDQAQLKMNGYFAQIQAGLAAAASKNPELAAPYERIFNDMRQLGEKAINPTTRAETSAAMFSEKINQSKLLNLQNEPRLANAVAMSEMFRSNPNVLLGFDSIISKYVATSLVEGASPEAASDIPKVSIVGSKNEKDLTAVLGNNLDKVAKKGFPNNEKATQETATVLKQYLGEVAESMNNANGSPNPARMTEAAKLIASDGFGAMASKGQVDSKTMQAAGLVWMADYKPAVMESVQAKLASLPNAKELKNTYTIEFSGAGIQFTLPFKGVRGEKEIRARQEVNSVFKDLKKAEAGVNQIIRAGAHLQGNTDYAGYWEEHKAEMFPDFFEPVKKDGLNPKAVPVKTEAQMAKAVVIAPNERQPDSSTPASNIALIDVEIAREQKKKEPSAFILKLLNEERAKWAK
jgi:hypothetical protein